MEIAFISEIRFNSIWLENFLKIHTNSRKKSAKITLSKCVEYGKDDDDNVVVNDQNMYIRVGMYVNMMSPCSLSIILNNKPTRSDRMSWVCVCFCVWKNKYCQNERPKRSVYDRSFNSKHQSQTQYHQRNTTKRNKILNYE